MKRRKKRNISHDEVIRIINSPQITYPSKDGDDRTVFCGELDDGRPGKIVLTDDLELDTDALIVTVIDCEPPAEGQKT